MRVAAALALVAVVLLGAAGCKCTEHKERAGGHRMMMRCPMCSTMMEQGKCDEMMGDMGMDMPARTCCGAMMSAKMSPAAPCMLMAMKDHLNLTEEQMDKLAAIRKGCMEQAEALLTADQKAMLEKMKSMPPTMMEMHKQMHGMMERCPMREGAGKEGMQEEMK